jgi:dihydropteroate synthase
MTFKGQLLDLSKPIALGILNATPDSFHSKSRSVNPNEAVELGQQMWEEGATIIDIGGQSTRPGASRITSSEELDRVLPVIEELVKHIPNVRISIDTFYGDVAKSAVEAGAGMVNDISAGKIDPNLWTTVAKLQVPYVLMHMQRTPSDMQVQPVYENVLNEVINFLGEAKKELQDQGVQHVIIDPGFGFGKTLEHNHLLLKGLSQLQVFGLPILVGISRKSMVNNLLEIKAVDALNGTSALHLSALQNGAKILRVHDVKEACEVIKIYEYSNSLVV